MNDVLILCYCTRLLAPIIFTFIEFKSFYFLYVTLFFKGWFLMGVSILFYFFVEPFIY